MLRKTIIGTNIAKIYEVESKSKTMHRDKSRKLEKLVEENKIKLNEVESNLLNQKEVLNKGESIFSCEECDETFRKSKTDGNTLISAIQNISDVTIVTKLLLKAGNTKHNWNIMQLGRIMDTKFV